MLLVGTVIMLISINPHWRIRSVLSLRPIAIPTASPRPPTPIPSGQPPQFVLLSFDGSLSLEMWAATRQWAREMMTAGRPVHLTYFISGVYFLDPAHAREYQPPGRPAGTSAIGFSDSRASVLQRIAAVNQAVADGHEIASHLNGHWRGGGWSLAQWQQELDQFRHLIFDWTQTNNFTAAENPPHLELTVNSIIGLRTPLLSRNDHLYKLLPAAGYRYDSSGVAETPQTWPTKNTAGTWLIPLAEIPMVNTNSTTIAMDYNFYSRQTDARDTLHRNTPAWQKNYDQVLNSYRQYFQTNYHGNRAPILIGNHFSLWNDGLYWEALKTFATEVCAQPEVRCVTFRELVEYLDSHPQ
jgi:peptidoglycan/xylan/chitin deacetylase (PgdA/CDA1 family)